MDRSARGGPIEAFALGRQIERAAMLSVGRRLGIQASDRAVRGLDRRRDQCPHPIPGERRQTRGSFDQPLKIGESLAGDLVGLDPRRRDAGVLQHPMRKCPGPSQRIVLERQPSTLMREVGEQPFVDRGADPPFDDGFPDPLARRLPRVGPLGVALTMGHAREPTHDRRDRQGDAVRG